MKCINRTYTNEQIIQRLKDIYNNDDYDNMDMRAELEIWLSQLDATLENQLAIAEIDIYMICYMTNYAEGFLEEILKIDPSHIFCFNNATEEQYIAGLQVEPHNIRNYPNPSNNVKMEALKLNPSLIEYLQEPTNDMINYAISKAPENLKHIKDENKTLALQEMAIDQNSLEAISGLKHDIPETLITKLIRHSSFQLINTYSNGKELLFRLLTFRNINSLHLALLEKYCYHDKAQQMIRNHKNYQLNIATLILDEIEKE